MTTEVIGAFLDAMRAAGIEPAEPIDNHLRSGKRFYFRAADDKPKQRKGWAVLYLDERPCGAFGHFRSGVNERWRFSGASPLSAAERAEWTRKAKAEATRREAEQLAERTAAAEVVRAIWNAAGPVDPNHPYLVRKGIVGEGLRQHGNRLLVPMLDAAGRLWNVQSIDPAGNKLFAKRARQKDLHLLLGQPGDSIAIAEGYGTGAVIRRATKLSVAIAFSASNLTATALAMRNRFPAADIVVGADDDAHLVNHPQIKRNLGLDAARAAAQAVGGRVAIPPRRAA